MADKVSKHFCAQDKEATDTKEEETYEDLVDNNLQNDGDADRFDDVYMGVKKAYRPDWLTNENKIFVNKLNFVCKNFD